MTCKTISLSLVLAVMLNMGCPSERAMDSKRETKPDDYVEIDERTSLGDFLGRKVLLEGTVSAIPWQHLISIPESHPHIGYLDRSDKSQIVVYTGEEMSCRGKVKVWGRIVEVRGESKRPGSGERYREYQIIADRWECDEKIKEPGLF